MSDEELFPLVDEDGNQIGKATRRECHSGTMLLHPVVHLHVFNAKGELYLQKRSTDKDIQPGKWDTSVGGHVDYGETVENALKREAREELGLEIADAKLLYKYVFKSRVEKELVNTYMIVTGCQDEIKIDPVEIEEGRFWKLNDIKSRLGSGIFTPNFEMEFERLGVCPYSAEEDTPAYSYPDQVPQEVKEARRDAVMELQQDIAFARCEEMKGKVLTVMVEGKVADEPVYVGRTYMDAPNVDGLIFIHSGEVFMSGDFVRVKVTGAAEYDLIGEVYDESAQ